MKRSGSVVFMSSFRRATSLSSFVVFFVCVMSWGTTALAQDTAGVGAIAGTVRDPSGRPAAGVRVCALDTPSCATSDAQGAFRIADIRAGSYHLEVLPTDGLPFTSEPIEVRAGLDGRVEIALPKLDDLEQVVTVTAPAFRMPEEIKNSGLLVTPREILKNAGALQDVSRYVQSLPGVVIGTDDSRNDIIVRGGSPLENLFVVDNVEIPNINAFANFASAGGNVGILDAELLQDVTFLTGGYPAPYINRTSSVMQVTLREGSRDRLGGWATLGFAGAGAILEGPIGGGQGIVGGVGAPELFRCVHEGPRVWRCSRALHAEQQGRVRRLEQGPRLACQHLRHRQDSPGPH
ncbi:MAG: carboxypeptidase regulatory-like domain-containing protein [Acidobacteria bacterium]|nr:carboxypeptidase regulatory-like domain-containing protein [Acidobacteriota bacterium]